MFPFQVPPLRDRGEIEKIMGPSGQREPSRDLKIVWVWGVDKAHGIGIHEYGWAMDRFVNTLLPQVPRVTAVQAMYFPTEEQWETADLVVFYLQSREVWGKDLFDLIDAYQGRGGGLIFLHLGLLQGTGEELAKRVGLAFGGQNALDGPTKWGAMPTPVNVTAEGKESQILKGFPSAIHMIDELYWNLTGDPKTITTLMTSSAGPEGPLSREPKPEELDGKAWPVMWMREKGRSKTFATVSGHNYFSFNDPYFRIILLRAMAWAMGESFDPFKPLVESHLER